MLACVDWVLITFGTQVIQKKQPVWPVFPDYLSVSYDYVGIYSKMSKIFKGLGLRLSENFSFTFYVFGSIENTLTEFSF